MTSNPTAPTASRGAETISRTGNDNRGFTLAEMLVVLLLISVMLALSTPVLRGAWRDARFRASARAVTARLGYAHSRSIVTGLPVRLVLNRKNNSSHLEIEKQPGQFEPLRTADASERSLPEDTAFADITGPGVDMSRDQAWITFFPDGTADARRFRIRGKDQQSVTITVHPATGAVTVNEM